MGLIFSRMILSRRIARILLTLCLLLVQAQLFASSVLGCRHAEDYRDGGDATTSCPFHLTAPDTATDQVPEPMSDCQKCALHCAFGVQGPMAAVVGLSAVPLRAAVEVALRGHFYHFSPDRFLKPPIFHLL